MSGVDPVTDRQQQPDWHELSADQQQELIAAVEDMLSSDFKPYKGCTADVWRAAVMTLYACVAVVSLGLAPDEWTEDSASIDVAYVLLAAGLLPEVTVVPESAEFDAVVLAVVQELQAQLAALCGVERYWGSDSVRWSLLSSHFWSVSCTTELVNQLLNSMRGNQLYEQSYATLGCLYMVAGQGTSLVLQPGAPLFVVLAHQRMYDVLQRDSHKRKALEQFCADSLAYSNSDAVRQSISILHKLYGPDIDAVQWQHSMQDLLLLMFDSMYDSMLVVPVLPVAPAPVALDIAERQKLYYILCSAVRKMMRWIPGKKDGWDGDMHQALNQLVWQTQVDVAAAKQADVALLCTLVDEGEMIYVKQPLLSAVEQLDVSIRPLFTDIHLATQYTFQNVLLYVKSSPELQSAFETACFECGVAHDQSVVVQQLWDMFTHKWLKMRSRELRPVINNKVVALKDMHKDPLRSVLNSGGGHGASDGALTVKHLAAMDDQSIHNVLQSHISMDGGAFLMSDRCVQPVVEAMARLYGVALRANMSKQDIVEQLLMRLSCTSEAPVNLRQTLQQHAKDAAVLRQ